MRRRIESCVLSASSPPWAKYHVAHDENEPSKPCGIYVSSVTLSLQQVGWTGSASSNGSNGVAQVDGTITATFTWVPDPSLPSDPPPDAVMVAEHCTAVRNGYGYHSSPTGTTNDGFGDPTTITQQSATSIMMNCSNFRSSVHSGASFTVTCSPNATTSGTMCSLYASVCYSAFPTPLVVNMSGITLVGTTKNILIGQGTTARTPPFAWDGTYGTIQITSSAPTSVLSDWTLLIQ